MSDRPSRPPAKYTLEIELDAQDDVMLKNLAQRLEMTEEEFFRTAIAEGWQIADCVSTGFFPKAPVDDDIKYECAFRMFAPGLRARTEVIKKHDLPSDLSAGFQILSEAGGDWQKAKEEMEIKFRGLSSVRDFYEPIWKAMLDNRAMLDQLYGEATALSAKIKESDREKLKEGTINPRIRLTP